MRRPQFSIVIPTRSRAGLLGGAIRSALAQTHDDFEVLVSDNFSDDATPEVIDSYDDARLRSVRSDKPLLMHDSWAFALSHARGEIITYLCDDDAIIPRTLEIVERELERYDADVAYWRSFSYKSLDWFVDSEQGRFTFGAPFSDHCYEVKSKRLLDDAFDGRVTGRGFTPLMLNTAVRREIFDRAAEAGTNIFRPSCPDYSAMLGLALHARKIIMIDAPLLVAGATPQSIGASNLNREEAAKAFIDELLANESNLILPDATITNTAWIAQTYAQCAHDWPRLKGREVNRVHVLALSLREINLWRTQGIVADGPEKTLTAEINLLAESEQEQVRRFMEERREIESEQFLITTGLESPVLGIGPFAARGGLASKYGFDTIDQLAGGLEDWLAVHACSLDAMWEGFLQLAGKRNQLIYGLGQNGRSLLRLRLCSEAGRGNKCFAYDDHLDRDVYPYGVEKLATLRDLSPNHWAVLVTPHFSDEISKRLENMGFIAGRDWYTPRQAAAAAWGATV